MERRHSKRFLLSFLALLLTCIFIGSLSVPCWARDAAGSIQITQANQDGEALSIFFRALSADRKPTMDFQPDSATLTVGKKEFPAQVSTVDTAGLGSRYVFLVDTSSAYISSAQFDLVKDALTQAIGKLTANDYAMILSMQDTIDVAQPFTNDTNALYTCVNAFSLQESPGVSLIDGIASAFTYASQSDAQYPTNAAILMFSAAHTEDNVPADFSPSLETLARDIAGDSCPLNLFTFASSSDALPSVIPSLQDLVQTHVGTYIQLPAVVEETGAGETDNFSAGTLDAMAKAAAVCVATAVLPESLGTNESYGVTLQITSGSLSYEDQYDTRLAPFKSDHNAAVFRVLLIVAIVLAVGLLVIFILYRRYLKKRKTAEAEQYRLWQDEQLDNILRDKSTGAAVSVAQAPTPATATQAAPVASTPNHAAHPAQNAAQRHATVPLFVAPATEEPTGSDSETTLLVSQFSVTLLETREEFSQEHQVVITANPFTIGRNAESASLAISDLSASREHCALNIRANQLFVADLHSLNHTFLERDGQTQEVSSEGVPVLQGDVLHIGDTLLTIHYTRLNG